MSLTGRDALMVKDKDTKCRGQRYSIRFRGNVY
jgi:hypothetical protein